MAKRMKKAMLLVLALLTATGCVKRQQLPPPSMYDRTVLPIDDAQREDR